MFYVNVSLSAATDVPNIQNDGSTMSLGLVTVNENNKWYLAVNNPQDYENPNQRNYRFSVIVTLMSYDVALSVVNVDDESPFFLLPDTTPCEMKVSNGLNKPHSLHIITTDPP